MSETQTETAAPDQEAGTAAAVQEPPAAEKQALVKQERIVVENAEVAIMDTAMFEHMYRVSKLMAGAKLVPSHFWDSPSDCMMVVQLADRLAMDPFVVAQKTYVISGTIGYEAQLIAAIINSKAPIKGRLDIDFEGDGDDIVCVVSAVFTGSTKKKEKRSPKLKDITTKNSPLWKQDPGQQLAYWTQRAWARLYCPDVIMGIYAPDELEAAEQFRGPDNARDITPAPEMAAPGEETAEEPTGEEEPPHDEDTGEIIEGEVVDDDQPDPPDLAQPEDIEEAPETKPEPQDDFGDMLGE